MDLKTFFIIFSLSSSTIIGTIKDTDDKEPLSGVKVILNDRDTLYTDFNGEFTFNLNDSIKKIDCSYISYSDYNKNMSNFFEKNIKNTCKK
ncbi:MAG: carboxypeptidase-like regulatory domain-containing protein [bacterium]